MCELLDVCSVISLGVCGVIRSWHICLPVYSRGLSGTFDLFLSVFVLFGGALKLKALRIFVLKLPLHQSDLTVIIVSQFL